MMLLSSFHCVCFVLRCVRYALLGARIVSVRRFSWGDVQSLYSSFHFAAVDCNSYSIVLVSHLIHAWLHWGEIFRSVHSW